MEETQVVTAVVTAGACTVAYGGAIKYLLDQLKALRFEQTSALNTVRDSLKQMDERKIDKEMCVLQHRQVIHDLEESREKFRDLLQKNTLLAGDVTRLATQLALILQRLELSLPRIEKAAAGMLLPVGIALDGK